MTAIHPQPEARDALEPLAPLGSRVARRAWHAWGSVAPWTWRAFQTAPVRHGLALTTSGVRHALQRSVHALAPGFSGRRMGSLQPAAVARFATGIADRVSGETIAAKYLPQAAAAEQAWTDLPLAGAGQPDASADDGFVASSLFETEAHPGPAGMREASQPPDGLPAPTSTGIAALELMRARSQSMAQRATTARSQAARPPASPAAPGQRRTFSRVEEMPSSPNAPAQAVPDDGAHAFGQGVSTPPSLTAARIDAAADRMSPAKPGAAATPSSRTVPAGVRAETNHGPQRGPTPEASEPMEGVNEMTRMPTRGSSLDTSSTVRAGDMARSGKPSVRMEPPAAHVQPKRLSVDLPLAASARQASGAAQRPQGHLPEKATAAGAGMAQSNTVGHDSLPQTSSPVQQDAGHAPLPPAETTEDAQHVHSARTPGWMSAASGRHASSGSISSADQADEPASPDLPESLSQTDLAHSDHAPDPAARVMRMALEASEKAEDQSPESETTVRTSSEALQRTEARPRLTHDERVQRVTSNADLSPDSLVLRRMHARRSDAHPRGSADSGREPSTARSFQPRGETGAEETSWAEPPSVADGAARVATLAANPYEAPQQREHVLVLARPSRAAPRSAPADTDGAPVVQRTVVSEASDRARAAESSAPAREEERSEGSGTVVVAPDLDALAREVLPIVKRLLALERERTHGR